ncbi:MAG: HTH-type transcriptional regulator BhcR [Pseudomonadota bacterium]
MSEPIAPRRSRGRPRNGPDGGAGTVQALDRGLSLLKLLTKEGRSTLTELALSAGMPASSAHRLLTTLQKHDFLEFDEATQEWMVGVEAFRVGSAFLQRTDVVDASRDVMRRLAEEVDETANLGIAEGGSVVFISQVECHNPIRAFFSPGTRGYMHASGIGKALLSTLSRHGVERVLEDKGLPQFTRNTLTTPAALFADLSATTLRGWAFDDEERSAGMRCVAAPVFGATGEAVAGLSVSGPTVRLADDLIGEIGPKVRRAAAEVTERLGGVPQSGDARGAA